MKRWKSTICALALAPIALMGCYGGEQNKDSGSSERMQNATITIVSGIAAEAIYGSASLEATIDRPLAFNSDIVGTVTPDVLDITMKIPLKDNTFHAERVDGYWQGGQDKFMFDWGVTQLDSNTYEISRVGFNGTMDLDIDGNKITGKYYKPMGLDFSFDGYMTDDGAYRLELDRPLAFDWTVTGTVTPR